MLSRSIFAAASTAALFATLAPAATAAPAVGEQIAQPGPIGAQLFEVSPDGRYVLFNNSYYQLPRVLQVYDRVTKTTTPVIKDAAGNVERNGDHRGLDISDDGKLVLAVNKLSDYGANDFLTVYEVETGKATNVGTLPGGATLKSVTGLARFTGGGTGLIFGATDTAGKTTTVRRTSLDAAPTTVVEAAPFSATRAGDVVTWSINLPPASRPASPNNGANWPATRPGGVATGFTIAGQGSTVVSRTKLVETAGAPAEFCKDGGTSTVVTTPSAPFVDDYGHTLKPGTTKTVDDRFPPGPKAPEVTVFDVTEDGTRTMSGVRRFGYPWQTLTFDPPSGTPGLPTLPELSNAPSSDGSASISTFAAKFFSYGTGIVRYESDGTGAYSALVAYGDIGAGTKPAVKVPAPLPGQPLSPASLQPDISWATCAGGPVTPKPLGTIAGYANISLARNVETNKPAGTVKVTLAPSAELRAVPAVKLQVRTLGFTTWSKTVRTDGEIQLPRPYWLLPQHVIASVSVPADPVAGTPAETLQYSVRWQAYR